MAGLSAKSQPRCDWFVGNKNGISVSEGAKLAEWQAKSETKIIASIASGKEVDGRVTMIQQKMFHSVYIKVLLLIFFIQMFRFTFCHIIISIKYIKR